MATYEVQMSESLWRVLERIAAEQDATPADVVKQALADYADEIAACEEVTPEQH